jgi:hypothetical protein
MGIKKNKTDESGLSKNNGESVKYRIRKQEEFENEELIREYLDGSEDLIGGPEAEVPGTPS